MANKWKRLGKHHAQRLLAHIYEKADWFEANQTAEENAIGLATLGMFVACIRAGKDFKDFSDWLTGEDADNSAEA